MADLSFLGGIGGAAIGGIASLFNHNAQKKENERNRQFQLKMQQLNQNFTKEMYNTQNADNLEQWNRQNAYDSPEAQMSRMRAAGLNADLMYGGGSSLGSAMSLGSSAYSGLGSASDQVAPQFDMNNVLQGSLMQAQIDNINASTRKTESETEGQSYTNSILESDAKYRDAYNQGIIDSQDVSVRFTNADIENKNANTRLTNEQFSECRARQQEIQEKVSNLRTQTELLKKEMESLGLDIDFKNIRKMFEADMFKGQIAQFAASAKLSNAQAIETMSLLTYKMMDLQAGTEAKYSAADLAQAQEFNERKLGFTYDWNNKRLEIEISRAGIPFVRAMNDAAACVGATVSCLTGEGRITEALGSIAKVAR